MASALAASAAPGSMISHQSRSNTSSAHFRARSGQSAATSRRGAAPAAPGAAPRPRAGPRPCASLPPRGRGIYSGYGADDDADAADDGAAASNSAAGSGSGYESISTGDGGGVPMYSYDPADADNMFAPMGPGASGFWGPGGSLASLIANLDSCTDTNALQTALAAAIQLEDFQIAAAVRDRLRTVAAAAGADEADAAASRIDWASTGLPEWLGDRAMRLGYRFPTEVQRRSAPVLLSGADCVVGSDTGSGKTLSFLLPLLARLRYPPDIFLDQMKGPQAVMVVPTMELGVQVALLAFKLLGGNISSGRPGDAANMFTYFGPKGIKVRGVLTKEEVVMAKSSLTYLNQVHLVVATPSALMEAVREPEPASQLLAHLRVLAVDEVDECFSAFPRDMEELMATAVAASAANTGEKPQVVFVGATQRQDVLEEAVDKGWLQEPVSIRVGKEGTIPSNLSHRYIVVPPERRLAALARSLRADLAEADADAAPARVMLFVNTPAEAAAVAEPLQSSLWTDHRMAVLVPPGTILAKDVDNAASPSSSSASASSSSAAGGSSSSAGSWPPPELNAAALRRNARRGGGSSNSSGSGSTAAGAGAAAGPGLGAGAGAAGGGGDAKAAADTFAEAMKSIDDMFAYNPIRALHSFRDHKSSLLLATGPAARGLDLPAVSHVYSLGPPPDATNYLHRAGRAGRIGSTAGGVVTTLVTPDEVPVLQAMAAELGISLVREEEATGELVGALPRVQLSSGDDEEEEGAGQPGAKEGVGKGQQGGLPADVDRLRKGLEDLYNLM
ncbi:hypothetical protein HYH02_009001 [Chlamydomonas schloesseri]|uniref:RNA helicase n=1 Tax=Chlamydomonas schloesseri TaxID=2026947 RepID=A0A835WB28_9CHLO|nr:hypothetical protein HYH02_009001 [Chlamydomonas schloesseri]|eukprot:KAG2444058.1 hypothetical protein HYH02_009001 [Chlamydomonas schloesseri]